MKAKLCLLTLFLISSLLQVQAQKNTMDTVSYSLGMLMASNLKQQGFDELDAPSFMAAMKAVMAGEPTLFDANEANQKVQAYMQGAQAKKHEKNIKAGADFLAENAKRKGVTVTASGLQYEVLKPGDGKKPSPSDKVTVHYHGTLIDGTVFDSSVERGQPATFGVTQVIQGWVEGLQLMPMGAKYKFFIPYDLAYGERAAGAAIKPYSALVFEVELIGIN